MQLPVQTFTSIVQQMAATLQGASSQLVDMAVGSVLRALLEATASVALWLQWLILQVLSVTRAATSVGSDLDSWMADFSFLRLPAASASGIVTFSRYSTTLAAVIPVGTIVRTTQGLQTFVVISESANAAWNGDQGYSLPLSVSSVSIPVVASQSGISGNVQGGAIGLLSSPIPGVDTVTNAYPLSGGANAETDAAFRARFQLYINSRSLATKVAILAAVASVQLGLRYTVLENQTLAGDVQIGNFCVIVDDGSGDPPAALLTKAQSAVELVRPIGSTFSLVGPVVILASVNVVLLTSNVMTHAAVTAEVQGNIVFWIASLPIAGILAISKIEAIAHDTDPTVISVTSALINGVASDLIAANNAVMIAGAVVVN